MTRPTVDEVMRLATAYAGRYGTCPYDLMVEAREKLCAAIESLIAAPAAPQQAEPVAQIGWADEFGNLFPMGAWKPAQRTHHDSHKTAWRAVYLHPPAAEVQQADTCPTCGSDCNERDELEKAEREIERLRRAPARPEDMAAFAAELKADPVKALAFFQSAGILNERGELTPEYAAPQQADAAYTERNHLVALLSKLYPAGKARTAIEGWSPEWHGCVYIDFPWGQASWHYHDRDAGLFNHLEPYRGSWDGHTTEAKYELIRQAVAAPQEQANMGPGRHWWPVSKGHADNVCAAAPQQAEPVSDEMLDLACDAFEAADCPGDRGRGNLEIKLLAALAVLHPPAAEAAPTGPRTPDPTMVICPACTSQFTATPESVQAEVQRLRDALEQIEHEANQPYIQRIAAAALEGGA